MPSRGRLGPMVEARSIAVIGASTRRGSVGNTVVRQLVAGGFDGEIMPVNPKYDSVEGMSCFGVVDALPASPDLAVLAISDGQLVAQAAVAIAAGARALAVFGAAAGPVSAGLAELCARHDVPLCGANGMGFVNMDRRLRVTGYYQPPDLAAGGVTFLTHSGSLFSAMLHNRRDIQFNFVVSTGTELVVTMDEYLAYALELPTTRLVALFIETVRRPTELGALLERAWAADIPVVALAVGRTARARDAIATHSAALAGDGAVAAAWLRSHGVAVAESMDEMADTIELLSHNTRIAPGGLGAVLDSGGERALLIDLATKVGVALPSVTAPTQQRLAAVLAPGFEPDNPVDAWSTSSEFEDGFVESLAALDADPAIALTALAVDLTAEETDDPGYAATVAAALTRMNGPLVVMSHVSSAVDARQAGLMRAQGVPVLRGTASALAAIRELQARSRHTPREDIDTSDVATAAARLASAGRGSLLVEEVVLAQLHAAGIPVAEARRCHGTEAAVAVAEELGYPVALKAGGLAHKADVGGVRLGLDGPAAVAAAYDQLAGLGDGMLVQPMALAGVELALGGVVDPVYGPAVVVAAGDTWVELLADTAVGMAPVDAEQAAAMIRSLRIARRLEGLRGEPAADVAAAADAVATLSRLVWELRDQITSLDVNPLIVTSAGVMAVDAVVVR